MNPDNHHHVKSPFNTISSGYSTTMKALRKVQMSPRIVGSNTKKKITFSPVSSTKQKIKNMVVATTKIGTAASTTSASKKQHATKKRVRLDLENIVFIDAEDIIYSNQSSTSNDDVADNNDIYNDNDNDEGSSSSSLWWDPADWRRNKNRINQQLASSSRTYYYGTTTPVIATGIAVTPERTYLDAIHTAYRDVERGQQIGEECKSAIFEGAQDGYRGLERWSFNNDLPYAKNAVLEVIALQNDYLSCCTRSNHHNNNPYDPAKLATSLRSASRKLSKPSRSLAKILGAADAHAVEREEEEENQ